MKNVYILDDNEAMRSSLSSLLDAFGFDVQAFNNGKVFIDEAPALDGGIALIDLQMPVLDGFGVLERIREWTGKFVPIVLSAREDDHLLERLEGLGAKAFFRKPFEEALLVDRLNVEFSDLEAAGHNHTH